MSTDNDFCNRVNAKRITSRQIENSLGCPEGF